MYEFENHKIEDKFKDSFNIKKNSITHKADLYFKLLPYKANDKNLVCDFSGVIGSFSRLISNKKIEGKFDCQEFLDEVLDKVLEYGKEANRDKFKDIVSTVFLEDGKLINFDIKTLNYINSGEKKDDEIALFLYSILFDESIEDEVLKCYNHKINNVLYKFVLSSLPNLKECDTKLSKKERYFCYAPYVREMFIKDFKFLIKHEELYRDSLKRFLEYYYVFYVSQLVLKLDKFEKADLEEIEKLYYTLSWESTSKNRTAYRLGLELLKSKANSLYSHALTLEILNMNEEEEQLGYVELGKLYNSLDKEKVEKMINKVIDLYQDSTKYYIKWENFKKSSRESDVNGFNEVYKLFDSLEYQFLDNKRNRAYKAYSNWFLKFIEKNFGKRRGSLGYNLNITEDDIILMTKLCINDKKKIKLNVLFEEFEKRGLFFDRESSKKIIQLYERLNLLEKKSDSGDAQYVRSVL